MLPVPTDPLWSTATIEPREFWRPRPGDDTADHCRTLLAALPARRFPRALEFGCAGGALTRHLASDCDTLLALDPDPALLQTAELRCEDQPWVQFGVARWDDPWPEDEFDLVVLHDMLHLVGRLARRALAARTLAALNPGGAVLLMTKHRGPEAEAAIASFASFCQPRLALAARHQHAGCRIDVLS